MTERDFELLGSLECAERIAPNMEGWLTPLYCGAWNGSHHSQTLRKLVKKGLAESKHRGGYLRGLYRITEAGLAAWREEKQKRKERQST